MIGMMLFVQCVEAQTAVAPTVGDGSKANPYQIATLENLYWIASDTANWKYYYIQTADINASETSSWFEGQGWPPIGNNVRHFTGGYNGKSHIIDSLFINRPGMRGVGLFGYLGTIDSVGITHANITGGMEVGSLAGHGAHVKGCFASGYVSGAVAGGLVGENDGEILSCYSATNVHGGPNDDQSSVGGLVGANVGNALILNSYSLGEVNGGSGVGGLVGYNMYSLIMNSYSAGKASGTTSVGGLVGINDDGSNVYNSYWNTDSSGQSASAGGKGKTTVELRDPSLFINACWDSSVWSMDVNINNGCPYLSWQNPGGTPLPQDHLAAPAAGDGSVANPYRIATLKNLCWLASNPTMWKMVYSYVQTADINASETRGYGDREGWMPIGAPGVTFWGVYDGGGHTIDSLFINRPGYDYQGLFGAAIVVIDSLGIVDAEITGNGSVGCLSGNIGQASTVRYSFSTGKVTGTGSCVGGLVGYVSTAGKTSNCYSKASVDGTQGVGGLVGFLQGASRIDHCYSSGTVSGNGNVGGLVGQATVSANITSSFWDRGTSGRNTSAGGIGKTTPEMRTGATFSSAGWSDSIWFMDASLNEGYPYLSWENQGGTPLPISPGFSLSVAGIGFGAVPIDSSKEDSVLISNPGTDTLRITKIVSPNNRFAFTPATMDILPSGSAYLFVNFTPHDTSTQSGFIIITDNAPGSPDSLVVSGQGAVQTAVKNVSDVPTAFAIGQNYPNPFNPTTRIDYFVSRTIFVSIKVYDVLGRNVAQLVNEVKRPGRYSISYDGTMLPSGVYFYSMSTGTFHRVKKMVLMK